MKTIEQGQQESLLELKSRLLELLKDIKKGKTLDEVSCQYVLMWASEIVTAHSILLEEQNK